MRTDFFLMHLNDKVAHVKTEISFSDFKILEFDVINEKLLPIMIKNMPNKERVFKAWWENRVIPTGRREFYNLIRILCKIPFKERPLMNDAIYAISLASYGQNLTDKYWFNPENEVTLSFAHMTMDYMQDIIWEPKSFEDIDYFTNGFDTSLNKFFINSRDGYISKPIYATPSLNTNGFIQKYWDILDGQFFLMKYLYNVSELNFNEIIINDYLSQHYSDLSNKIYLFKKNLSDYDLDVETEKTFNLVASKCFIDKDTEFVPASEIIYATGGKGNDVYDMYYDGCELLGIENAEYPVKVSDEIETQFGIEEDRNFDNFGFIRDARTHIFIKPSPLFGNSYYKYILRK